MYPYKLPEIDENFYQHSLNTINNYTNNLTTIDLLKDRKIDACPYCNCRNIIKYGRYRGLQRFKCLNENCKRTFSQKTKTLFSHSKKSSELWIKYFILMNNGKSLRECAAILNINLATSFYWRHKILITQNKNYYSILKNYVEVSKIMIKENFKGDKKSNTYRKEKVFIACAMDSNKNLLSKVIARYTISLKSIDMYFSYNIDKNAVLSSYNDRYFDIYSKKHNSSIFPIKEDIISKIVKEINDNDNNFSNKNYINDIKNLNSNLPYKCLFIHSFSLNIKRWLMRFRGVATKYLENYLNWHIIEFKNDYKSFSLNQIDFFKVFLKDFSFIKTKDFSNYNLLFETII